MRRAAAVCGTALVVVLAVVGFFALSGTGTPRAVTPALTPTATATTLSSLLDSIEVPPNALAVPTDPTGRAASYGSGTGFTQLDRYWTTQLTPLEAINAMTVSPPAGLTRTGYPYASTDGPIEWTQRYDAAETATTEGPHVVLNTQALPSGLTALSAHLWETVKPAKTADEVITGALSSVSVGITTSGNVLTGVAPLTGAKAQRLVDDVNGLWVKLAPEAAGCGGSPASSTDFTLTFHAGTGDRIFTTACDGVYPSPVATGDPTLWKSRALVADLQADFGSLLPAPLQQLDYVPGPQPAPVTPPANLAAIIDQLAPPSGAKQIDAPPDLQDGRAGYADQPGYQQAIRAWTTTLDPDAAIAALTQRTPTGMTGAVRPPFPSKGPPDASASYKAVDTATRVGPQLELSAVENTPGTTTIEALAWQLNKTAKPARDRVTGTVTSVSGSWSESATSNLEIKGAVAQRLADDVNALLVNDSPLPHGCGPSTAVLTLTFHTTEGDESFADSCGLVQVLPTQAAVPELQTSDGLNLDVNRTFARLLPTPLPSSAPLPTSGAPNKSADQVITAAPATVSIETIQAVSKGKQRMTDQTFDLTGATAAKMLAELKAMQVYTGAAPAGCTPGRSATMHVIQRPRQLTFTTGFCVNVFTSGKNDPLLQLTPALEQDLDWDFAKLRPTRSTDPAKSSQMAFSLATTGTEKDKIQHPVAGRVVVTQDGVTIGRRNLAAGEIWRLQVRPGIYTVTSTAKGYHCASGAATVEAGLLLGPQAGCTPN